MLVRVLVAIREASERESVCGVLAALPDVFAASVDSSERLWDELRKNDVDLVASDRSFLGREPSVFIDSLRKLPEAPEIVVFGANDEPAARARLLALGCLAVIPTGLDRTVLDEVMPAFIERFRREAITRILADRPEERHTLADFVSQSPAMLEFLDLARRLVHAESSLLIMGETGVGKERLARAIHAEGPRASGPFMAVNCAALVESLLESELFGHEKGAFTGAVRGRKGFFELAHRGTLFLDEIGEMALQLQAKLLRAVDERKIFRVGAERPLSVDVRVMAATNRNLEDDIGAGRFRADLFYRLAVVTLQVPPLRQRQEDISDLVISYLEHFRLQTGRDVHSVAADAQDVLRRYTWPGNVRELINAIERAVLLCRGPEITVGDLPRRICAAVLGDGDGGPCASADASLAFDELRQLPFMDARKRLLDGFDSRYLTELLESTGGRVGDAAARAGVSERTLRQHLKRFGLRKERFRAREQKRRRENTRPHSSSR